MNRTRIARRLAGAAAATLALAAPAAAHAGTYQSVACSPLSTPGLWVQTNTDTTNFATGNECGGPPVGPQGQGIDQGSLYAEDNLTGGFIAPGAEAGWTFTAPTGTTITGVSYYASIDLAPGKTEDLFPGMFEADGTALEECAGTAGNNFTCAIPNNQAPETFTGLDTTGLFFGIKCAPVLGDPNCAAGSTEHYAQAEMYSVSVTLAEAGMPTISQEGGPLWAGGVVSGTVTLTFTATDPSGIASWSLSDDQGSTLYAFPESCDYTQVTPCAQLTPEQLNVDTTRIPDGNHTVTITATNAAGNQSTATSPALVVDNNGPGTPVSLSASPAGGNTINVAWGNPASPPQPITGAVAELCAATCTPTTLPDSGHAQLTAPGPGNYTVRLWLTDSAGKGGTNVATTPVTVPAVTTTTTTTSTTSTQSHKPAAPKLTITHRLRQLASDADRPRARQRARNRHDQLRRLPRPQTRRVRPQTHQAAARHRADDLHPQQDRPGSIPADRPRHRHRRERGDGEPGAARPASPELARTNTSPARHCDDVALSACAGAWSCWAGC